MPKLVLICLTDPIVPFNSFPENALSTLSASAPLPRKSVPPLLTHAFIASICISENLLVSKSSIIIISRLSSIL